MKWKDHSLFQNNYSAYALHNYKCKKNEITEYTRLLQLVTDVLKQFTITITCENNKYTQVYLYVNKCVLVQVNKCVVVKFI